MRYVLFDPYPFQPGYADPTCAMLALGTALKKRGDDVVIIGARGLRTVAGWKTRVERCAAGADVCAFSIMDHSAAISLSALQVCPETAQLVIGGPTVQYDSGSVRKIVGGRPVLAVDFSVFGIDTAQAMSDSWNWDLYAPFTINTQFLRRTFFYSNACSMNCTFCRRFDEPRTEFHAPIHTLLAAIERCPGKTIKLYGPSLLDYPEWRSLLSAGKTLLNVNIRVTDLWNRDFLSRSRYIKTVRTGIERVDELGMRLFNKRYGAQMLKDLPERLCDIEFRTIAHFILGVPGETDASVDQNLRYADTLRERGIEVRFFALTPQTNSELYRRNPLPGWWIDMPIFGGEAWIIERNFFGLSHRIVNRIRKLVYRHENVTNPNTTRT